MDELKNIQLLSAKIKEREKLFYKEYQPRITELIDICKKHQRQYLESHHGPGSWATTYSNEFIAAAAELFSILKQSRSFSPITKMSQYFKENNIRSCRGTAMNIDKVEYLYKAHIKSKNERSNY